MARTAGLKAIVVSVNNDGDIDAAFSQFTEQRVEALIVSVGVFFSRQRDRLDRACDAARNPHDVH